MSKQELLGCPTEEEILEVLRGSELYRQSNYIGKTTGEYSQDGISGEVKLSKAIHKLFQKTWNTRVIKNIIEENKILKEIHHGYSCQIASISQLLEESEKENKKLKACISKLYERIQSCFEEVGE